MHDATPWLTWKRVSLALLALGLALLAMMVTTEGEPGALPLLLILLGGVGYGIAWRRSRR